MPCATAATDVVSPSTLKGTFAEEIAVEAGATPEPAPINAAQPIDLTSMLAQMSTEEIRALLVDAGGDAAAIDALTDEQLRAALSQALAQMEATQAETGSPTVSENVASPENISE
jgi:hypothetical protein